MMEELRKAQRDYGAAFAKVLMLAKQSGLDHPTVERLLHALTLGPAAADICDQLTPVESLRAARLDTDLDRPVVSEGGDHMQAALQRAALAFRHVVDAVHKVGVPATA